MEKCECCAQRKKERDAAEYKSLMNRIARIEGQLRGVRGMLESDAYCIDIITQVSAISSALASFNKELLSSHIKSCVADDIRCGSEEKVEELVKTLSALLK